MGGIAAVGADPRSDLFFAAFMLIIGILMLIYRNQIGEFTGYYVRGNLVNTPTPGWMLIPFALMFIIFGIRGVISAAGQLLSGGT